jgi:hypothetical protein
MKGNAGQRASEIKLSERPASIVRLVESSTAMFRHFCNANAPCGANTRVSVLILTIVACAELEKGGHGVMCVKALRGASRVST